MDQGAHHDALIAFCRCCCFWCLATNNDDAWRLLSPHPSASKNGRVVEGSLMSTADDDVSSSPLPLFRSPPLLLLLLLLLLAVA